jgi:hypothetical protein
MFDWGRLEYDRGGAEAPVLEHKDTEIKRPAALSKLPRALKEGTYYTLHFDGGCRNKLGTGGWVLFDQCMEVILA